MLHRGTIKKEGTKEAKIKKEKLHICVSETTSPLNDEHRRKKRYFSTSVRKMKGSYIPVDNVTSSQLPSNCIYF
jgi:hypothetical protein